MSETSADLRKQWGNPNDILSLLLLIGGDIVQKAIAQLIGYRIRILAKRDVGLSVAPVAFSFGWVAYGFSSLLAAVGDKSLMPLPERASIVVNCANGFVRQTNSWVLSRLIRDHESRFEVDPRPLEDGGRAESVRIDIFKLEIPSEPTLDLVWWLGWVTIGTQLIIALVPWVLDGDWGVMMMVFAGNMLCALTCSLPQWTEEKWASRKLEGDQVTCLTRGNGYPHIMVFIGTKGCWNVEGLSTGSLIPRAETPWILITLAALWVCLLLNVAALKEHSWILVVLGGIGMIQNVFAAGASRNPSASNFHLSKFSRASTIIGRRQQHGREQTSVADLEKALEDLTEMAKWVSTDHKGQAVGFCPSGTTHMPPWVASMSKDDGIPDWLEPIKPQRSGDVIYAAGIHGALIELEKWVPTAGLAMLQIYFPSGLRYNDSSVRDDTHKINWRRFYHTSEIRRAAEKKRMKDERTQKSQLGGIGENCTTDGP